MIHPMKMPKAANVIVICKMLMKAYDAKDVSGFGAMEAMLLHILRQRQLKRDLDLLSTIREEKP